MILDIAKDYSHSYSTMIDYSVINMNKICWTILCSEPFTVYLINYPKEDKHATYRINRPNTLLPFPYVRNLRNDVLNTYSEIGFERLIPNYKETIPRRNWISKNIKDSHNKFIFTSTNRMLLNWGVHCHNQYRT